MNYYARLIKEKRNSTYELEYQKFDINSIGDVKKAGEALERIYNDEMRRLDQQYRDLKAWHSKKIAELARIAREEQ